MNKIETDVFGRKREQRPPPSNRALWFGAFGQVFREGRGLAEIAWIGVDS
jgi:hypothetical protein